MAGCSVTTTNMRSTTGILWGTWRRSSSRTTHRSRLVFEKKYKSCGGKKMKRSAKKLKVSTGTVEAFFERSRNRARKLDRGEKLPTEMRLTFEDPSDLLRVLTAQRV